MPSDNKKKRDARKKEAAKSRLLKFGGVEETKENGVAETEVNVENGIDEVNGKNEIKNEIKNGANDITKLGEEIDDLVLAAKFRSCTGVLTSHSESRDIHIDHLSMRFHGAELLMDTSLNLNVGRRYGLIGANGCGKSSLLSSLESRELPVPKHTDIYLLRHEMQASEKTALESVMEVEEEKHRLEKEAEELSDKTDQDSMDQLMDIYERLDDMDASKTEAQAAFILHGLGFTKDMQNQKVKNFSGGWRMRIALARVLLIKPGLLLLDEPTNHLDLDACVWLENELKTYKRILVVISHSQDFLNGVCTNIIHMQLQTLKIYTGNYDSYVQTRFELEENQMKKYKSEQDQIAHMKNYIARFGHGSAKLARQAQSKEKVLKKMVDGGLTDRVARDQTISFCFPSCGTIPPPVIMVQHVSFRYADGKPLIYQNLDFGVDLDTRVALVGPNGAGKSTLLNLIVGDLAPTDGLIRRHSHLRIARYHQHLQDQLNLDMSAINWMMAQFPAITEREEMRKIVGRYGLSGPQQVCPIRNLSDGQRCRVIFAWLAWQSPHLLLLDEPTNHLDIETIDTLAEALNDFEGGIMLVSHDFRLISQVAQEIWVCEKQTVTKWEGDIYSYKEALTKKVKKRNATLKKMKK